MPVAAADISGRRSGNRFRSLCVRLLNRLALFRVAFRLVNERHGDFEKDKIHRSDDDEDCGIFYSRARARVYHTHYRLLVAASPELGSLLPKTIFVFELRVVETSENDNGAFAEFTTIRSYVDNT